MLAHMLLTDARVLLSFVALVVVAVMQVASVGTAANVAADDVDVELELNMLRFELTKVKFQLASLTREVEDWKRVRSS